MSKENEALQFVYSQVADEVSEMYERYREKCGLEEETDTERQLEILTSKKFISSTYISNLSLIADYYARGMDAQYYSNLQNYKVRMQVLLESV